MDASQVYILLGNIQSDTAQIIKNQADFKAAQKDHEDRIDVLEKKQTWAKGYIAAVASLATFYFSYLFTGKKK